MRYCAIYELESNTLIFGNSIPCNQSTRLGQIFGYNIKFNTKLSAEEVRRINTAKQIWDCNKIKALKGEYIEEIKKSYEIFLELKKRREQYLRYLDSQMQTARFEKHNKANG